MQIVVVVYPQCDEKYNKMCSWNPDRVYSNNKVLSGFPLYVSIKSARLPA